MKFTSSYRFFTEGNSFLFVCHVLCSYYENPPSYLTVTDMNYLPTYNECVRKYSIEEQEGSNNNSQSSDDESSFECEGISWAFCKLTISLLVIYFGIVLVSIISLLYLKNINIVLGIVLLVIIISVLIFIFLK